MSEIDKQFQFFLKNQESFVKEYPGRFIVICGEEVKGDFESALDAYFYARKNFEPGSFLIQLCVGGMEAYTATISTLGVIAK